MYQKRAELMQTRLALLQAMREAQGEADFKHYAAAVVAANADEKAGPPQDPRLRYPCAKEEFTQLIPCYELEAQLVTLGNSTDAQELKKAKEDFELQLEKSSLAITMGNSAIQGYVNTVRVE
eukprot:7002969-Alexandrium_andersonii.AAC.1